MGEIIDKSRENLRILVFAKNPAYEQALTRLNDEIGNYHHHAHEDYSITDMLEQLNEYQLDHEVCVYPSLSTHQKEEWLGRHTKVVTHKGHRLIDRLRNALQDCFENGLTQVIAAGLDYKAVPLELIRQAVRELGSRDCVLGPSGEGGFYLVGFNRSAFDPEIFTQLPAIHSDLFNETITILEQMNIRTSVLPEIRETRALKTHHDLVNKSRHNPFEQARLITVLSNARSRKDMRIKT